MDPQLARIPFLGARKHAKVLLGEIERLENVLESAGLLDLAEAQAELASTQAAVKEAKRAEAAAAAQAKDLLSEAKSELAQLQARIAQVAEAEILQEIGIYEFRHPLEGVLGYEERLKALRTQIKEMSKKDGGAVECAAGWRVNDSAAQGRKMTSELKKLMLRAFNSEAEGLVSALKPYKLDKAIDRLQKSAASIQRLGKTMSIVITQDYIRLRIKELELTADFLERRARDKEAEKEERARIREEQKAQRELERERSKLLKEQGHYENALAKLEAAGDEEAAGRMREQLAAIAEGLETVDLRAANSRAGYVYVISNIGSFGEGIVKIGMTRRLNPEDRVRELGDASVPFRFDIHALVFSQDAVALESELHSRLETQRVNRVNLRREFFRATPSEVREHLREVAGDLLTFEEAPEAEEYRMSISAQEANPHI